MLADSEAEWAAALDAHRPRYAILFEDNFNYLSKMCLLRMRQAAFEMIAMAKARGCCVILWGGEAPRPLAKFLGRRRRFVLLGEGEEALAEVMDPLFGRPQTPL